MEDVIQKFERIRAAQAERIAQFEALDRKSTSDCQTLRNKCAQLEKQMESLKESERIRRKEHHDIQQEADAMRAREREREREFERIRTEMHKQLNADLKLWKDEKRRRVLELEEDYSQEYETEISRERSKIDRRIKAREAEVRAECDKRYATKLQVELRKQGKKAEAQIEDLEGQIETLQEKVKAAKRETRRVQERMHDKLADVEKSFKKTKRQRDEYIQLCAAQRTKKGQEPNDEEMNIKDNEIQRLNEEVAALEAALSNRLDEYIESENMTSFSPGQSSQPIENSSELLTSIDRLQKEAAAWKRKYEKEVGNQDLVEELRAELKDVTSQLASAKRDVMSERQECERLEQDFRRRYVRLREQTQNLFDKKKIEIARIGKPTEAPIVTAAAILEVGDALLDWYDTLSDEVVERADLAEEFWVRQNFIQRREIMDKIENGSFGPSSPKFGSSAARSLKSADGDDLASVGMKSNMTEEELEFIDARSSHISDDGTESLRIPTPPPDMNHMDMNVIADLSSLKPTSAAMSSLANESAASRPPLNSADVPTSPTIAIPFQVPMPTLESSDLASEGTPRSSPAFWESPRVDPSAIPAPAARPARLSPSILGTSPRGSNVSLLTGNTFGGRTSPSSSQRGTLSPGFRHPVPTNSSTLRQKHAQSLVTTPTKAAGKSKAKRTSDPKSVKKKPNPNPRGQSPGSSERYRTPTRSKRAQSESGPDRLQIEVQNPPKSAQKPQYSHGAIYSPSDMNLTRPRGGSIGSRTQAIAVATSNGSIPSASVSSCPRRIRDQSPHSPPSQAWELSTVSSFGGTSILPSTPNLSSIGTTGTLGTTGFYSMPSQIPTYGMSTQPTYGIPSGLTESTFMTFQKV